MNVSVCRNVCVSFLGVRVKNVIKDKMSKYSLLLALHPRNRLDPIFLCLHKCMSVCKSLCHSCIYDLCLSVFESISVWEGAIITPRKTNPRHDKP